ncbi:hypothetical protein E0H47_24100 [Rhizobium leguminosarum bv. viciae]|uniref:hypothetical protein n=1 Tax=Rhizobium leguminosarum TaxID=384 RepID=UPI00103D7D35|nr:hypothetical protein [Rhizobium leguminosarum]TBZ35717.1 hypothetical protein E0H47_24100 [Rhizobium leguminosarum bv. viciae]
MTDKLLQENRGKLLRNLALSTQTVIACGHAMRVTVADMLQDFDNIRAVSASDPQALRLCEALERAIEDNTAQNRQVFQILGLDIA